MLPSVKRKLAKWAENYLTRKLTVEEVKYRNDLNEKDALENDELTEKEKDLIPIQKRNAKVLKELFVILRRGIKRSDYTQGNTSMFCGEYGAPVNRIGIGPRGMGVYTFEKEYKLEYFMVIYGNKNEFVSPNTLAVQYFGKAIDWFVISFRQNAGLHPKNTEIEFKKLGDAISHIYKNLESDIEKKVFKKLLILGGLICRE